MASEDSSKDSPKTSCIFPSIFECFSSREDDVRDGREWPHAHEREVHILNEQPHLVQPMTLTLFDDLPPLTTASQPSRIYRLMSKSMTSLRASVSSQRHGNRPHISAPIHSSTMPATPIQCLAPELEPLELTIHKGDKRLSNLPRFSRLSFTDQGELKSQPRTLTRTQSEHFVPCKVSLQPKPGHMHPNIPPKVITTSRPASEHEALHSHPVSTASLPFSPPPIDAQAPVEPTRPRPVETKVLKYYHPDGRVQRRISRWLATNNSSSWDTADISERATFYQTSSLPRGDAPGVEHRQRIQPESTVVSNAGTDWSMGLQNPTNTSISTLYSPVLSGFVGNSTQAFRPTNSEAIDRSPLSAEVVDGVVDDIMVDKHGEAAARGSDVGVAY